MDWGSIVQPVLPLTLGALGYFVTRLIERRWFDERLDRARKAAALKREMDDAGLDLASLAEFTELVTGGRKHVREREDAVSATLPHDDYSGRDMTPQEINDLVRRRAEDAADRLKMVTVAFADELERDEAYHLRQAMDAWELVVENHAQLASLLFRGGTAAASIYWFERERMTVTRIAEIETLLAERRSLLAR